MTGRHSPADLALLAELRALLDRLDPVPDAIYAAAYQAVVLIGSEQSTEPLELVGDSTLDHAGAGMRGSSEPRVLDFAGGATEPCVRLEVCDTGDGGRRLVGLLAPTVDGAVAGIRSTGESPESVVDRLGRFRLEAVPRGPMRLEIRRPCLPPMRSRWFLG